MRIPKYIIKKINKARELSSKLEAIRSEIIKWDYKVDAENIPYCGANASNLSEAIQCYIDYGEDLVIDENNEVISCTVGDDLMSKVKLENLMEPWTNICIFPDGKIFYGESSHDMIIYNTAREHEEYNTIWEEIQNWQNKLEKDSVKFWGYDGVVLGLDFSIRHNIVRVYGLDGYRKSLLLCDETTNNLSKEQLLTLYEIRDGFKATQRCIIERWYDTEVTNNEN